jgi:dCMP deaminase
MAHECKSPKWLSRLADTARLVSTWSKDPKEHVGCAIASPDFRSISVGYNGPPSQFSDAELARLGVDAIHEVTIHAEMNAIMSASRDLRGWSMAVTKAPCMPCAMVILRAGISDLVLCDTPRSTSRWYRQQMRAIELMTLSGVRVWLSPEGDVTGRFSRVVR